MKTASLPRVVETQFLIFISLIYSIYWGFRPYYVGTDTANYQSAYNNLAYESWGEFNNNFDLFFNYSMLLSKSIGLSVEIFFVIYIFVSLIGFLYFGRNNEKTFNLYFLLLILFSPAILSMTINIIRQLPALVFLFGATIMFFKEKNRAGIFFLFIASMFHLSVIFYACVLAAFFFASVQKKINKKFAVIAVFTLTVIFLELSVGNHAVLLDYFSNLVLGRDFALVERRINSALTVGGASTRVGSTWLLVLVMSLMGLFISVFRVRKSSLSDRIEFGRYVASSNGIFMISAINLLWVYSYARFSEFGVFTRIFAFNEIYFIILILAITYNLTTYFRTELLFILTLFFLARYVLSEHIHFHSTIMF